MKQKNLHIVEVKDLTLSFPTHADPDPKPVLDKLSFNIRDGEILGLIGNSGSGKSMTSLAISGLLPRGAVISSGEIIFKGRDVLKEDAKTRRKLLGDEIGFIFQEPATALDPLMKVGKNLEEILVSHGIKDKNERKKMILEMFGTVGFSDPEEIFGRYPHRLSGGQRQRVLIAGAALLKPKLLICDEPTSALDTITTVQVLDLLKMLCIEFRMTILFISHDLSAVGNFCDRVMVMKDGKIVEKDTAEDILLNPRNAYTAELLANARLDPARLGLKRADVDYTRSPILTCRNLSAGYEAGKDIISGIDIDIFPNEIVGLIGSSGCGKTTLTKAISGLIGYKGEIKSSFSPQVVFQDPVTCLNPAHTVLWHLMEPLKAKHIKLSKDEACARAVKVLEEVGFENAASYLSRFPNRLSGGQRQRIAIAMCLMTEPEIILADEPFSNLDASTAAEILKLLMKINLTRKTAILLISHNLHIVRAVCSRVIVMSEGRVAEEGMCLDILKDPQSKAAADLLQAENFLHGS
ncbi:MAG: ABC transporter ATP-binding protein [Clostridiales bacterium]|nr:ABC transporter ATP-binding protein [Clostridiales bacterium]